MEGDNRMEEHRDPGSTHDEPPPGGSAESNEEAPGVGFSVRRRESFLFNTRIPFWKYVIRMGLLSLLPSLLFAAILAAVGIITEENAPSFEIPEGVPPQFFYPFLVVGFLFCSPVFETLILVLMLWGLSFLTQKFIPRAITAGVAWGILHSISAPAWGLVVWWPFFIFSCAYLTWRRVSWVHAFLAAALIHLIQNIVPAIAVVMTLAGSGT
jgi:hypothetical protein